MRGIWGAAGLTGGLALGSCVDLLPYQCADDGDCTSMDGGLCEADSYCSYPDDACPSGRRYSDLAGILSGKCAGTPPGGSGDTVDPTLGSDTSASTMSSGSGPDPDSSGDIGLPECGDGMVDDDEECDDGNEQDGDGCNTDCVRSGSIRWEATYAGSAGEDDRYFGLALTGADAVVTAGYIVNEAGNRDVLISRWPADGVDPTHVFHDAGTQSDAAEAVAYVDSGDVFICGVAGGDPWVSRWTASLDTLTAEAIVAELELEALAIGRHQGLALGLVRIAGKPGQDMRAQPVLEPLGGDPAQDVFLAVPAVVAEMRQDRLALGHPEGTAPGNRQGVVDGIGQIGEQRPHLLGRLEIVLGRQAAAVVLLQRGALRDAHQGVVRLVHVAIREIDVVGGDQRQVQAVRRSNDHGLHLAVLRPPVTVEFDVEATGKGGAESLQQGFRILASAFPDQPAGRAVGSSGKHDQPFAPCLQAFERHLRCCSRLGFQKGRRNKAQQILVTLRVLHQDHDGIGFQRALAFLLVAPDRELRADDRLHPAASRHFREFQRAEQVAAVGHRDRRHAPCRSQVDQRLDVDRAFGKRIGAVDTQMDEIAVRHGWPSGESAEPETFSHVRARCIALPQQKVVDCWRERKTAGPPVGANRPR